MAKRNVLIGLALLAVAVLGAALGYYRYETRDREVRGTPTEEFVATDNPADTTKPAPKSKPKPKSPGKKPRRRAQPPADPEPWPTYGLDVQRTHVAAAFAHRPPYRVLWTLRARHYLEFPPVVAYGKLFVPQQKGRFFAADARTGKLLWSKSFRRCAAASPTVWRGVVYQPLMHRLPCRKHEPGATGLLIAMNARTGRELWGFKAGAIESSPLQVNGVLYFGSWDHYVYALDARTKRVRWRYRTDDRVVAGPAYAHGTIYVPSNGGRLYALDARTGRLRWRASSFERFGRREYFYATPTVAYGRVYVGNADGYVYAYGATTGHLLWAQRAGTYVYTAAAAWKRTIYVGTWDGYLVALDAATGDTRWRHNAPGSITGAPTVMSGLVYFSVCGTCGLGGSRYVERGRPQTFALNARTGRVVWRFPDGKYSPIVADRDRVYLVGRTRVYGLAHKPKRGLVKASSKPRHRQRRSQ
jgi:outer membrane protein assembly factor BamB